MQKKSALCARIERLQQQLKEAGVEKNVAAESLIPQELFNTSLVYSQDAAILTAASDANYEKEDQVGIPKQE